jgi:hypothetical protein
MGLAVARQETDAVIPMGRAAEPDEGRGGPVAGTGHPTLLTGQTIRSTAAIMSSGACAVSARKSFSLPEGPEET